MWTFSSPLFLSRKCRISREFMISVASQRSVMVHMCLCVHVYQSVCVQACVCVYMCISVCVCKHHVQHVCTCLSVCMAHVCMYVSMSVHHNKVFMTFNFTITESVSWYWFRSWEHETLSPLFTETTVWVGKAREGKMNRTKRSKANLVWCRMLSRERLQWVMLLLCRKAGLSTIW